MPRKNGKPQSKKRLKASTDAASSPELETALKARKTEGKETANAVRAKPPRKKHSAVSNTNLPPPPSFTSAIIVPVTRDEHWQMCGGHCDDGSPCKCHYTLEMLRNDHLKTGIECRPPLPDPTRHTLETSTTGSYTRTPGLTIGCAVLPTAAI